MSKPRKGQPLVESVIVTTVLYELIVRGVKTKWLVPNSCILVHAYDAFKGRPREVRTV